MPISRIEGRRARSSAEVQSLIEALYLAQRETLRVLVEITLYTGRSLDAKRSLYQQVVERFGAVLEDRAHGA